MKRAIQITTPYLKSIEQLKTANLCKPGLKISKSGSGF